MEWTKFDPEGLRDRLVQVKSLLEQAAAVAAAQDAAKLEAMTDLAQKQKEEESFGHRRRRRYR